ncbi:hypothetical protein [Lentzea aerocolonigenes]|uniref:hypothetical protein n=1 Tax=Lentzea aerocolonigenes TaxID=68170 RepID=UPI000B1F84C8|nr:hypothetical protein [Lentzea aerocolonigenes]
MGIPGGIEDHPDLRDAQWGKRVEREWRREQRTAGKTIAVAALAAIALIAVVAWQYAPEWLGNTPAERPGVDFSRPFAGTDYESWADGERAVVAAPEFDEMRKAVIAARIDPAELERRDGAAFLALFPEAARPVWRQQLPLFVTQLSPGVQLLPNGVKAQGTIGEVVNEQGEKVVRTDFRIAYAFAPDDPAAIHRPEDFIVMAEARLDLQQTPGGLRITNSGIRWHDAACGAYVTGLVAPKFAEARQPC